jgi:signal transduction histidine kinase
VSEPSRPDASAGPSLVYIVDDDTGMRETVVEILRLSGIGAAGFGSGAAVQAAIGSTQAALEAARPDLVVVDQRLPDTTGIVLATSLKSADPDLSVILLTGYASADSAIAAVGLVDDYLTKPVPPDDLVRRVKAGVDRTRLRRENRYLVTRLQEMNSSLEATVAERTRELEAAHLRALEEQAARERLQVQAERERLENRLHQSQRLESLGLLAGGVAHDFNNLLSVILNCAAFVAEATTDNEPVQADVAEIRKAARQAAQLTRQLLIFGRRDRVQLEALDMGAVVADVHSLLARSIGEHIKLVVHPPEGLPPVRGDRSQIETVLVNLAINARDAMPHGGTLTIESGMALLGSDQEGLFPPVPSGRYVTLSVTDTGVGMSPDVVMRIFEPFFTTKPQGHGTGLGLATVHGIVAAAGGGLSVQSEPGVGTTIRAFFPAAEQAAVAEAAAPVAMDVSSRGETLLVVEDEPAVLQLAVRMLRRNGYSVIPAATGTRALALAAEREFDMLLTDVVMPEMSGLELAERVSRLRPAASVLFMSGYSPDLFGDKRALAEGIILLQKPFTERALLEAIRAAMAAPREVSKVGPSRP